MNLRHRRQGDDIESARPVPGEHTVRNMSGTDPFNEVKAEVETAVTEFTSNAGVWSARCLITPSFHRDFGLIWTHMVQAACERNSVHIKRVPQNILHMRESVLSLQLT